MDDLDKTYIYLKKMKPGERINILGLTKPIDFIDAVKKLMRDHDEIMSWVEFNGDYTELRKMTAFETKKQQKL